MNNLFQLGSRWSKIQTVAIPRAHALNHYANTFLPDLKKKSECELDIWNYMAILTSQTLII